VAIEVFQLKDGTYSVREGRRVKGYFLYESVANAFADHLAEGKDPLSFRSPGPQ